MKRKNMVVVLVVICLIAVLCGVVFQVENNKDQFKVSRVTAIPDSGMEKEFILVEDRFNVSLFDSLELRIEFPMDYMGKEWEQKTGEAVLTDLNISVIHGEADGGVFYVRYDMEDELYDVVFDTVIRKKQASYQLSCVQRVSKDASTIKFDRLKIKKI